MRNNMYPQQMGAQNPFSPGYQFSNNPGIPQGNPYNGHMVDNGGGSMNGLPQGLASILSSFFQQDPSKAANQYLDKIPGEISPFYQPWMQGGQQSLQMLLGQMPGLLNDPGGMLNKFGQDYKQSPGYNFELNQATNAGNNAAAAGGYVGSPQHQYQMQQMAQGLASQDYNNWMNQTLGLYGQGMNTGNNISNQGLQASNNMAQQVADARTSQASNAYAGAANHNQSMGGLFGGIASALSDPLSAIFSFL